MPVPLAIPAAVVVAKATLAASCVAIVIGTIIVVLKEFFKEPPQDPLPATSQKSAEQLIREAREGMGMDTRKYNLGFSGNSGSGKSSLVNALRGLRGDDEGDNVALTGESETTERASPYDYEDTAAVFWDLPGGGTTKIPAGTYVEKYKLFAFDCIIVVAATRFTELDFNIAKEAKKHNVPVIFVRNKIENDIEGMQRRKRGFTVDDVKQELRKKIPDEFKKDLARVGLANEGHKLHLVSAWQLSDREATMDEVDFLKDILEKVKARRNPGKK